MPIELLKRSKNVSVPWEYEVYVVNVFSRRVMVPGWTTRKEKEARKYAIAYFKKANKSLARYKI